METWKAILIGALGTWLVAIFAIWGEGSGRGYSSPSYVSAKVSFQVMLPLI